MPLSFSFPSFLQHLALYMGSLVRAVLALHDLTLNKVAYRDEEGGANPTEVSPWVWV